MIRTLTSLPAPILLAAWLILLGRPEGWTAETETIPMPAADQIPESTTPERRTYSMPWLGKTTSRPDWKNLPPVTLDVYPWYNRGKKQETRAWAALSETDLWIRFECEDDHISAIVTEPNGPVCTDDCVEFFFSPDPDVTPAYFNIEINCIGTVHLGQGDTLHQRGLAPLEVLEQFEVRHSIPGPRKDESPDDRLWELEARVPLSALQQCMEFPMPVPGAKWRGNFYRCGGKTNPQFAVWSHVQNPYPNFHMPGQFGYLEIGR